MNDLDLPPHRPLPPEVRDRIRAGTYLAADEVRRPHRFRAPLTVAAAVAVLAAGAVMIMRPAAQPTGAGATPPRSEAERALDRCHEALFSEGRDTSSRDQWRLELWESRLPDGSSALAAYAGDEPVICSIRGMNVAVSIPGTTPLSVPGTGTGVLLRGSNIVGGVVDPSWPRLGLAFAEDGIMLTYGVAKQSNGLFLMPAPNIEADVEAYPITDDARLPVDRWLFTEGVPSIQLGVGNATPEEKAALTGCGLEPKNWFLLQSIATENNGLLLVASKDGQLVACHGDGQSGYTSTALTTQAGPGASTLGGLPSVALPRQPVAGYTTMQDVVLAELYFGDEMVPVAVMHDTFMLVPPSDAPLTKVRLLSEDGALLWEGPLAR